MCELNSITVDQVREVFPKTPRRNIAANLPFVITALCDAGLTTKNMVCMALATIRAETESFRPITEMVSRFNTAGRTFDLYDNRKDLGNQGPPDGRRFAGRGYIQLTGRDNYARHGRAIGLGDELIRNPERANEPEIAARLLASFLGEKRERIEDALRFNNLRAARRLVNGGVHGLDRFTDAYNRAQRVLKV